MFVTPLCDFVPGGPVEQAIMKLQMGGAANAGAEVGAGADSETEISEEMIEELKKIYGFDKPLPVAYASWLWNVLQFDLGSSYDYDDPVWDLISERISGFLIFWWNWFCTLIFDLYSTRYI